MIGRLIALFFLAREVAHREHLKAPTIAIHLALGEFYEAIVEHADELAESYQGRTKTVIKDIPILAMELDGDQAAKLRKIMEQIEKIRFQAIDQNDSVLQNIVDDALKVFLKTLNKLDNYK